LLLLLLLLLLQVKKTTFAQPDPDHVFGLKMAKDPEGAKEGEISRAMGQTSLQLPLSA
jgi:hypothetical protein